MNRQWLGGMARRNIDKKKKKNKLGRLSVRIGRGRGCEKSKVKDDIGDGEPSKEPTPAIDGGSCSDA